MAFVSEVSIVIINSTICSAASAGRSTDPHIFFDPGILPSLYNFNQRISVCLVFGIFALGIKQVRYRVCVRLPRRLDRDKHASHICFIHL
ncbi:hypothetical protein HBI25_176650 [Parastagonospora nodorum]|nr:hypothetical protein HBH54_059510 [Parastagonospora nodorum]KAH4039408.1 hypothetical protein HBI09_031540 [Parastagonospora nodorum]KAH4075424.1 hypothetical protein HBH50_016510 [Parastagonospora nodorum]KAH4079780.1 hypothetical protein HBH46_231820 [Parastagonospora nodorum]KAH4113735.1 hypothetical protein HBH47_205960 [Parastagonospora nodorum]